MAKMVNFTLYIFYHNFKNGGGELMGEVQQVVFQIWGSRKKIGLEINT